MILGRETRGRNRHFNGRGGGCQLSSSEDVGLVPCLALVHFTPLALLDHTGKHHQLDNPWTTHWTTHLQLDIVSTTVPSASLLNVVLM